MRRSVVLLLLFPLIFTVSCSLDEELSYIEYLGRRYMVSGAVDNVISEDTGRITWYLDIGTEDMVWQSGQSYWEGSGLRLQAELIIDQDNDGYRYDYVFKDVDDSIDPGTIVSLSITPDFVNGDGTPIPRIPDEQVNQITVSNTGSIFVVDFNVLMADRTNYGALLTGHFVGTITEAVTPSVAN